MSTDLHAQALALLDARDVPPSDPHLGAALRAVLAKCAAMRAEHQVGAFIAEEFERVIAEQLGVPIEDMSITDKESAE